MKIHYITGDATHPIGNGKKIIPHICNNIGAWGKGFVLAISNRWNFPEKEYRNLKQYILGTVQFVPVEDDIIVANMIAQHGIKDSPTGQKPIRYHSLYTALVTVNKFASNINATLHIPRVGCGLAGGEWNEVERIIMKTITVDVYVYDYSP